MQEVEDDKDQVPALQVEHTEDPIVDQVPELQALQKALEVALLADDHVPALHLIKKEAPETLQVPGKHAIHKLSEFDPTDDDHRPALQFTHAT
jgi:hypothetical protein